MLDIYIGYDHQESVSYHTLVQSIVNHSSVPVRITPVKRSLLPMYRRAHDPHQSNEFSFTRFLVPCLSGYSGWALFMDCDMMFRTDPKELFDLADNSKSVMVVKHDYIPKNKTKFLGAIQYAYPRKNWSSVMLFNCGHEHCKRLTPEYVNTAEPLGLHRFYWTHDDYIGEIGTEWNWLVGEYPYNKNAKNVHWTVGGPWFHEYRNVEYSREWFDMKSRMLNCLQLEERHAG